MNSPQFELEGRLAYLCQKAYIHSTWSWHEVEVWVEFLHQPYTVAAFRGSEWNLWDGLRDLRGLPWWDERTGWCHAGFLKGARGLWDSVPAFPAFLLTERRPVWLTGHSLGGALALVTGALMVAAGHPPAGIVTFGAPAVAYSGGLARCLAGVPCRQYWNGCDAVPSHPWLASHPGEVVHIGGPRDLRDRFSPTRYDDHQMAEYTAALRAYHRVHDARPPA